MLWNGCMVVQFSYGFTADGANRDLSFLDWCTFRRWIADRLRQTLLPIDLFLWITEYYRYNIRLSFFQTFPPFFFLVLCVAIWLNWGVFSKIEFQCGFNQVRMCLSVSVLNFFVFSKSVSLYCIRYFWFPILNHTVLVSSILFSFIFNGVKIS